MNYGRLPTVKVVNEDAKHGYMIINQEDFNDEIHVLYSVDGQKEEEVTEEKPKRNRRSRGK